MSNQNVSVDDILDGTLDDLADVPSFKNYPAGAHLCKVAFDAEMKDNKRSGIIFFRMEYIANVEMANPDEAQPVAGDKDAVRLDINNEFGQGNLKLIIGAFKDKYYAGQAIKNSEIMEAVSGTEAVVVTKLRKGKKGTDKEDNTYTEIVQVLFDA